MRVIEGTGLVGEQAMSSLFFLSTVLERNETIRMDIFYLLHGQETHVGGHVLQAMTSLFLLVVDGRMRTRAVIGHGR